jgi:hypothetical protein
VGKGFFRGTAYIDASWWDKPAEDLDQHFVHGFLLSMSADFADSNPCQGCYSGSARKDAFWVSCMFTFDHGCSNCLCANRPCGLEKPVPVCMAKPAECQGTGTGHEHKLVPFLQTEFGPVR